MTTAVSGRDPRHPMTNPAYAVELTMREREALMTPDDWGETVDVILARPDPAASDTGGAE